MASSLFPQQNNPINNQIISQAKSLMNNMNSPQMKLIMGMLKGQDPEQLVRQKCKDMGIDINELMNMFKSS